MLRELVSNNIFVFTSELYAQVTAGAIITPAGAIVIDTLAFPVETRQILQYVQERHGVPVKYVVNTHYHADHTLGTCLFDDARVVSHSLCRELLDTRGRLGLENARRNSREMAAITLRLPDVVFDEGIMALHLGGVTLAMWYSPGHSMDSIVCMVEEERVLFASDTMMPVPFFADGSWEAYVSSLEALRGGQYESIVQGHGEVILRGEVESRLDEDLHYLELLRKKVERVLDRNQGPEALDHIEIEDCGKNRIALNGLVQQLHHSNAETLYRVLRQEREAAQG